MFIEQWENISVLSEIQALIRDMAKKYAFNKNTFFNLIEWTFNRKGYLYHDCYDFCFAFQDQNILFYALPKLL